MKNRYTKTLTVFAVVIAALTIAFLTSNATLKIEAAGGTISGRVFQDYDGNGIYDTTTGYAVDSGVGAVTVKIYNPSGVLAGTTTSAATTGLYSIMTPDNTLAYRVEFTTLPTNFQPSAHSTNSAGNGAAAATAGSLVQFVPAGNSTNINLAVNRPVDYCQDNPQICIPEHFRGNVDGGAIKDFSLDLSSTNNGSATRPTDIVPNNSVGTVFGVAYNRETNNLYASAFVKRDAKLGALSGAPESTGAIYVKNAPTAATPAATLFVDLNAVFSPGATTTTGANPHPTSANPSPFGDDAATNASVGKVGLGDIKLSQDGTLLYAVNLNDKNLYVIPTTGALTNTSIKRYAIPTTGTDVTTAGGTCPPADVRPFGLGRDTNGAIYVGAVCSAESVTTNAATYLHAFVWKFSGTAFTLFANSTLNYGRKQTTNATALMNNFPWHVGDDASQPELMLTEIEFDRGNNMILGFRDKNGDESLRNADRGYGDILRASPNGATWTFENNGTAGGITTAGANTFGLGGGEYYINFNGDNRNEGSQGGLLQVPGFSYVMTTAYDAVALDASGNRVSNFYTGGIQRYSNSTGVYGGAYDVYLSADASTFAKANGLGDTEALCDKAPIEIGNRVWRDSNGDGVQTPGEVGIKDVTVHLYNTATPTPALIATAVTDANGEYYFSSATGTSTTSGIYGLNLQPSTGYSIRLDDSANYAAGKPLANLTLTASKKSTQAGFTDGSDSDGYNTVNPTGSPNGVFPVITLTTGASGANNHNYDFGFTLGTTAASVSVSGRVMDNRWKGIPAARVILTTQSGKTMSVTTNSFGYFTFNDVAGQSAVVSAAAKGRTFSQSNQFVSLTENVDNLYFIAD